MDPQVPVMDSRALRLGITPSPLDPSLAQPNTRPVWHLQCSEGNVDSKESSDTAVVRNRIGSRKSGDRVQDRKYGAGIIMAPF